MKAGYCRYVLDFKRPSGTSRGILTEKETWYIFLTEGSNFGIGECGILRSLSFDDRPDYEDKLKWVCDNIHLGSDELWQQLTEFPSIQFGVEQAFRSLEAKDEFLLFPSQFTKGNDSIPINGLIWMGDENFMLQQIQEKLNSGFKCIKMKIGAIDFNSELKLLKAIRKEFNSDQIELRVDANGAFDPNEALEKLKRLSEYELHSIEQPIRAGQIDEMAALCQKTPLPIALDEELIGVTDPGKKADLLKTIDPQYIILKPSLIGGYKGSEEWIGLCDEYGIGWWVTSALESNIGLNAIAQWTYSLKNDLPQGLGTGGLFTNNLLAPLKVKNGELFYLTSEKWNINVLKDYIRI